MRLLNTRTGEFRWVDNPEDTSYAILSHVWRQEGEQTFQDLLALQAEVHAQRSTPSGAKLPHSEVLLRACAKIRAACAYALFEGFEYLWIDSCCIDKTSSAELSEAINSMYRWYSQATVCYAFLSDVSSDQDPSTRPSQFRRSRWFTRGWTLQELIAPCAVIFLSSSWESLGGKDGLACVIQDVTGIDRDILTHTKPLDSVSVARRMSWAARRVTTRKEDEAYSLMGIFGINMPTIYGEGQFAFIRLQEEILRQIPDQSLFVWRSYSPVNWPSLKLERSRQNAVLLASSPADFVHCSGIKAVARHELMRRLGGVALLRPSYITTPYGLRTSLPFIKQNHLPFQLAILACEDERGHLIVLILRERADAHCVGDILEPDVTYELAPSIYALPWFPRQGQPVRRSYTRTLQVASHVSPRRHNRTVPFPFKVRTTEVHIIYRPNQTTSSLPLAYHSLQHPRTACSYERSYRVHLTPHSQELLAQRGYAITVSSNAQCTDGPSTIPHPSHPFYALLLVKDGIGCQNTIAINIWPCDCVFSSDPSHVWWLKAWVASSSGEVIGMDIDDPVYTSDLERTMSIEAAARPAWWWRVFGALRRRFNRAPLRNSDEKTWARTFDSVPCGAPATHIKSWPASDANGTRRWRRFTLLTGNGEEAVTMTLNMTCDYPGDRHYPAVFSLSVDFSNLHE